MQSLSNLEMQCMHSLVTCTPSIMSTFSGHSNCSSCVVPLQCMLTCMSLSSPHAWVSPWTAALDNIIASPFARMNTAWEKDSFDHMRLFRCSWSYLRLILNPLDSELVNHYKYNIYNKSMILLIFFYKNNIINTRINVNMYLVLY